MGRFVLLAAAVLLATACGTNDPFGRGEFVAEPGGKGGTGGPGDGTGGTGGGGIGISFTADVDPILDAKCAGCHAGGPGGLVIIGDPASDYDNVIDRVVPGDPENSLLLTKARGIGHGGGAILSEGDDNDSVIDAWIGAGAPNN